MDEDIAQGCDRPVRMRLKQQSWQMFRAFATSIGLGSRENVDLGTGGARYVDSVESRRAGSWGCPAVESPKSRAAAALSKPKAAVRDTGSRAAAF
jgi:hypothetical protein